MRYTIVVKDTGEIHYLKVWGGVTPKQAAGISGYSLFEPEITVEDRERARQHVEELTMQLRGASLHPHQLPGPSPSPTSFPASYFPPVSTSGGIALPIGQLQTLQHWSLSVVVEGDSEKICGLRIMTEPSPHTPYTYLSIPLRSGDVDELLELLQAARQAL